MKHANIIIYLLITISLGSIKAYGQDNPQYLVENAIKMIDGNVSPYNQVGGGDTIYIQGGVREQLLIRNFNGTPSRPIVFINYGGPVIISTQNSYGFVFRGCRYIRFTGTGDPDHFYGFNFRHASGAGLSLDDMSSDCEVDHISIEGSPIAGLYAKTDPDCSFAGTRDHFTQYNTLIHDNYIDSVGNEGMYIGSTKYSGYQVNCNGHDTVLYPSLLEGVRVYNNIVKYTGWDGIQVSSAASDCQVYNNIVLYDSQEESNYQMSGIILGGGSRCDCFNNMISEGKGDGIEVHGLGGSRVFNNIIVDPGLSYFPDDPSMKKYGIFVSDVTVQNDSSFFILFNDIINPKTAGIQFSSENSSNSVIASNVIINPGVAGAYVVESSPDIDVNITNNYFALDSAGAGFVPGGWDIKPTSLLVDAGYTDGHDIQSDFAGNYRPQGVTYDIGAYESGGSSMGIGNWGSYRILTALVYPNPASEVLTIKYEVASSGDVELSLYNLAGQRILESDQPSVPTGTQTIALNISNLPAGVYVYTLREGRGVVSGRIIKKN